MWLPKLIESGAVVLLKAETKKAALEELVSTVGGESCSLSHEEVLEKLLTREELMSTGIGLGLGIPHIRAAGISEPTLRIGIQPLGIEDYDSIDGSTVKILFMILLNEHQQREHVQLLSEIVAVLKEEYIRNALVEAQSGEEVANLLRGHIESLES